MPLYFSRITGVIAFVFVVLMTHCLVPARADHCNYCLNSTCNFLVQNFWLNAGETYWIYVAGNATFQTDFPCGRSDKWSYSVQIPATNTYGCDPVTAGEMCGATFQEPDYITDAFRLPEGEVLVAGVKCHNLLESCNLWLDVWWYEDPNWPSQTCNVLTGKCL